MTLEKAVLTPKDGGLPEIKFMFNPTELTFEKTVETSENKGSRSEEKGQAKVGFANTNPYKVTINKILFDTYETGEDVVQKYIEPFRKAVQFPEQQNDKPGSGGKSKKERTPLYTFKWGSNVYLRYCFVERLTYKLTMFLPNGTPVRAVIDSLSLKEADEPKPNNPQQIQKVDASTRKQDSIKNRSSNTTQKPGTQKKQQPAPRRKSS